MIRAVFALVVLGCIAAAGVVLAFSFLFLRPEQFVPVAYYRSKLYVTPEEVRALPPNADFSRDNSPPLMSAGVWRVEAEVHLLRPVPQRFRPRRGYERFHESNRPTSEQIASAGPERAAHVQIRLTGWEQGRIRSLGWPKQRRGMPELNIEPQGPVPDEMLQRILPVLIEDLLAQRDDPWLADAVRRGGAEPPALPLHRGPLVPWLPVVGIVITVAATSLMLAFARWGAERRRLP